MTPVLPLIARKLFTPLLLAFCFSIASAQCPHSLPFTENFSTSPLGACNGANGGWTSTTVASGAGWYIPNTGYAGGTSPEAEGYGDQANGGVSETISLKSPSLNTTAISSVTVVYKHNLYTTNSGASGSGTITVKIESSTDNTNWTQQYSAGYSATPSLTQVMHETRTITINGLSSNTLWLRFSVSGVLFKVWGYEIDDVNVTGTVAPAPTITNFTPPSACSGSGTSVTINGTNFNGASAVNFNGTSASFSVVSNTQISAVLPAGATTGVITVVTAGGTATSSTNFIVNPTPVATATPSVQSVCSGDNLTIALSSSVGNTTYSWTRNAPAGISGTMPASGSTDPSGTLLSSNTTATTVSFNITPAAGGCTGSAVGANVVVQPLPAMPGPINGSQTFCNGSSNTYSIVAVSGAIDYTWTLPNGWSGTSTSNSINTTAGSGGGAISVTANNSCGSSTPQTLTVTPAGGPSMPGTINGPDSICIGSTNTYSIASVNGATSYTWTLPNGWTGTSTTEAISVVSNNSGGDVLVTANNNCGSSSAQTLSITVETVPTTPGTISGTNPICSGSSNTYSIALVNGATGYTWTLPNGWIGSSNTETISAVSNSTGGDVLVTANNNCGSSGAQTLNVSVNPLPTVRFDFIQNPVCEIASPVTLSATPSGGSFSGTGVNGTDFNPASLSGDYVVTYNYTDANSCSASDTSTITVIVCTQVNSVTENNIFVSPNPFSNNLFISTGSTLEKYTVVLNDVTGKEVICFESSNGNMHLNTSNLAQGFYLLTVLNNGKKLAVKQVMRLQ